MRIIAGKFRGRILKSPPSQRVRPTSDRLRETLFNIISGRVPESRFLDLCAGSGAVGIEAISRGARHVTFVEQARQVSDVVRANLKLCSVPESQAEVFRNDAAVFLKHSLKKQNGPWDIVFFDPPYSANYAEVIELLGSPASTLLSPEGLLIVEHHHKKHLPDRLGDLTRHRTLKQGESSLSFYNLEQK